MAINHDTPYGEHNQQVATGGNEGDTDSGDDDGDGGNASFFPHCYYSH
eukprot:CAMPEP_0203701036 /NCGR_PEP_ID=MMETSP0091-20130426/33779_1 /ASSEMBLY_ACC=CAM_ASM_001089 /TAXON_ID=426623 /ORGANISM="Chaetoceros affinis, Strain CCMP159" /LENGTH=47 /DNA_ID= /DNA_START= /DNA_END= /DNA_ORIENTATION=